MTKRYKFDIDKVDWPHVELGPGDSIREEMEYCEMSAADLAGKLRVEAEVVELVVANEIAVDKELACRLSNVFKQSPQFWLNLQAIYDRLKARNRSKAGA